MNQSNVRLFVTDDVWNFVLCGDESAWRWITNQLTTYKCSSSDLTNHSRWTSRWRDVWNCSFCRNISLTQHFTCIRSVHSNWPYRSLHYIISASLFINIVSVSALLTDLSPGPSFGLCVCLSVRKVYCGKTADWIQMPFEVVSGVCRGMGILNGGGYHQKGRAVWG